MPNSIEWITGPVHTGKTTRLTAQVTKTPEQYCGLLAPVDAFGNRYLQDIISGERRILDCLPTTVNALTVGPYTFSEEVFRWGRSTLKAHHLTYPKRTLVIDEIGKLELRDLGLAPICWHLLAARQTLDQPALIIVRDNLELAVRKVLQ